MIKGSHKVVAIPESKPATPAEDYEIKTNTPMEYHNEIEDARKYLESITPATTIDILLRICDACHDMDNRTEPWVSIRRDIQRLK
jgi:hypothetical protein